jgi:hypothetical protein
MFLHHADDVIDSPCGNGNTFNDFSNNGIFSPYGNEREFPKSCLNLPSQLLQNILR